MAAAGEFIDECHRRILNLARVLRENDSSIEILESSYTELTALIRNIRRVSQESPDAVEVLEPAFEFRRPRQLRTKGRPLYYISREHLTHLVELGYTKKQMAQMLHVSTSVVKRRLRLCGINLRARFSTLSDEELDRRVQDFVTGNKNLGQRMVQAMLLTDWHRVQRQRVADSLIRVDEAGVAMRWAHAIQRRTYKVFGPNALWHIDGNHKLIRWGLVIHGGIDGYSRLITFLTVASNNKSATMMESFLGGTTKYGVPSRVRSDHGLENTGVGAFMLGYRGAGRGSFITGRSVHNQRIERMWRDMYRSCTHVFAELFRHLEETGNLHPSNAIHRWCLHFVYLPRIQRALDTFREAWNRHRLRTGGMTPTQLFFQGVHRFAGQGHTGIDDLVMPPDDADQMIDEAEYGVEEEGLITEEPHEEQVNEEASPLAPEQLVRLRDLVNPLEGSDLGVSLFTETVAFVENVNV
ncbi:uncharacterized protein LOC127831423 [Dreissena polymorpha]|nr:uncharacterized protein LOC127831423 [Dreissena polymorpha]